ncbi:hypothetical protein ILUMI_24984 [Ignelater luminosus]|uniref:Farnesyl diphosphate synthase n=1 Tax=Ignelater luminosus TaxID=2038154 RepID=A0A8K0G0F6_IGNLU|nr:hypothetical protein ILUMI_24984 [Ignelater luminosus]
MGQSLNASYYIDGRPQLHRFTLDRYIALTKYNFGFCSFHLPIAASMYLTGICDAKLHKRVKTVLLELGHLFQAQKDFLDCFGDEMGTDISSGRCTWFLIAALERANPAQKQILEDHYGREDPESQQVVRHLYEQLNLSSQYLVYEGARLNLVRRLIEQIPNNIPHSLFANLIEFYR